MKKLTVLWVFMLWCVLLSGCNSKEEAAPVADIETNEIFYENELVVEWVSSAETDWWVLGDGYLVLRKTFEDHSDVVMIAKGIWEPYFESENDYLPWNTISFKWWVKAVDGAAWTHYYEVVSIDSLKASWVPSQDEVKELLDSYAYCDTDEDCVNFYPWCPLGCAHPVNKQNLDIATKIANNFIDHQKEQCMYKCMAPEKIVCEDYKCKAVTQEQKDSSKEVSKNGLSSEELNEANTIFWK